MFCTYKTVGTNIFLYVQIIVCRCNDVQENFLQMHTLDPEIQATRNTSYLTASKSLNGRKIARMAPILTIFGPNRSQRRNLFFEKFSNERRRHRGIIVVVIIAVVVAVVAVVGVVGRFWVACIKGTSLHEPRASCSAIQLPQHSS